MTVTRLARLLGYIPATAWRAASKAPVPGAKVAGGVAKAERREKSLPRESRVCVGSLKVLGVAELLFLGSATHVLVLGRSLHRPAQGWD